MAEEKTQFELVSPARLLLSKPVDMVVVPGGEGDFGALPRHAPMIATVRPGVIEVHDDGAVRERIFVAGGFAEVNETRCTVLAEEAIPVEEITPVMAESRLAAAEQALDEAAGDTARDAANRALNIARAMQAAIGRAGGH